MIDHHSDGGGRQVLSVAQLNRDARDLLEQQLGRVWVAGEISNFAAPASGHCYFSLKEARAQVRCAMFRQRNRLLRFWPENGMQVLVRAQVSLYEGRGEFQLIVEHMEPAGAGALQLAFEQLKQRLGDEGLFAPQHKRPLPTYPQRIGILTSPSGAVLHDIRQVLRRRFPALEVVVYPIPVQGEGAAPAIREQLARAIRRHECDTLILARGGGSMEDLWAFNDEALVRDLFDCPIPLISAIGHEVDFTLCDFVADQRAPTPSAAAELASPDAQALNQHCARTRQRLQHLLTRQLDHRHQHLGSLSHRLEQQHPHTRLAQQDQRLGQLRQRLGHSLRHQLHQLEQGLQRLAGRLQRAAPSTHLLRQQHQLTALADRLQAGLRQQLTQHQTRLAQLAGHLEGVSPLQSLSRGYALIQDPQGRLVTQAAQVQPGAELTATLARGQLHCEVKKVVNS